MAEAVKLTPFDAVTKAALKFRNYDDTVVIGQGNFGKVAKANYTLLGRSPVECAVKVIFSESDSDLQEKLFRREVLALKLARHRSVVQLWEYFKFSRSYVLTMEWCPGKSLLELLAQLGEREFFPLDFSWLFAKDLCSALHYLHDHSITHRDLKPENVLFDRFKRVKLADFGFAKMITESKLNTVCGSRMFMAPELIRTPNNPHHDPKKLDVWGWGFLTYLVFTKRMPFQLVELEPQPRKPTKPLNIEPKLVRENLKGRIPPTIVSSLQFALQGEPSSRTTMCAIQGQQWYKDVLIPQQQQHQHQH